MTLRTATKDKRPRTDNRRKRRARDEHEGQRCWGGEVGGVWPTLLYTLPHTIVQKKFFPVPLFSIVSRETFSIFIFKTQLWESWPAIFISKAWDSCGQFSFLKTIRRKFHFSFLLEKKIFGLVCIEPIQNGYNKKKN